MTRDELRKRWIEALRSGEYQQAYNQLRDGDGFCCLGVLCDLYDSNQWSADGHYMNRKGIIPGEVENFIGLRSDHGVLNIDDDQYDNQSLSEINDDGATFSEIADILESGVAWKDEAPSQDSK